MPNTTTRLPARSTLSFCILLALALPATAQEVTTARQAEATPTAPGSEAAPADPRRVHDATDQPSFRLDAVQMEQLPLQRDLLSAAALAPDAIAGDPAFGHNFSFGGGAVSENRVSVNGFDITNSYKGLDLFRVPFEAIDSVTVSQGGRDAAIGRATGANIAALVKRGGNDFAAGARLRYEPDSLRGTVPDVSYPDANSPGGRRLGSDNSRDSAGTRGIATAWVSGAPIRDRFFAYAVVEMDRVRDADAFGSVLSTTNSGTDVRNPGWLLKLDGMLSDDHLLELTAFGGRGSQDKAIYRNDVASTERGDYLGTLGTHTGGETYVLKYTGYLTDRLTMSAMIGQGESRRGQVATPATGPATRYYADITELPSGCPVISDVRTGVTTPIPHCNFAGLVEAANGRDRRRQGRLAFEWQLGEHLLSFGADAERFDSVAGETYEGGAAWRYSNPVNGQPRVRKETFASGARVGADSDAAWLQDDWRISDAVTASVGLRWDRARNSNDAGQDFIDVDLLSPRLGLDWRIGGEHAWLLSATAGRYLLPLASNVGDDTASPRLFTRQFYTYTGIDPVTGAPLGATPVGGSQYLNHEYGLPVDPRAIADADLKATYQDEATLSLRGTLGPYSVGARAVYRDLQSTMDDNCDTRYIYAYALQEGIEFVPTARDFPLCRIFNPGRDGHFLIDVDGDGTLEQVDIPADVLGPSARRRYQALEVFAERHWEHGWFAASYVRGSSSGNTEGGVKSDIGQSDTGITQDFDYPELMIGADGHLPNDRKHVFKAFGSWEFAEGWSLGANLLVASGRPINCFGYLGGQFTSSYQNSYFSCDPGPPTLPGDGSGNNGDTIVPRGSVGRTPWVRSLDLALTWAPAFADRRLRLRAEVFNAFDAHSVLTVVEQGENAFGVPQPDIYRSPTAFQPPRSVRFSVSYDF